MFGKFLDSVCVCVKNFTANVSRELIEFHEDLYLVVPRHNLISAKFWLKSFNWWRCCFAFSRIFGRGRPKLPLLEITQNYIYYKKFTIKNNIDIIYEYLPYKGALLWCFSTTFVADKPKSQLLGITQKILYEIFKLYLFTLCSYFIRGNFGTVFS